MEKHDGMEIGTEEASIGTEGGAWFTGFKLNCIIDRQHLYI
jgi:hypothetical protein